eukprot:COSAG06_NODE_1331_length_9844_cov_4.189636_4_plen_99_part_00
MGCGGSTPTTPAAPSEGGHVADDRRSVASDRRSVAYAQLCEERLRAPKGSTAYDNDRRSDAYAELCLERQAAKVRTSRGSTDADDEVEVSHIHKLSVH